MHAHKVGIVGRMELPAINAIVEQSVASWDAAERVKRLAIPRYQYVREDLDHMWLLAASDDDRALLGFAALEEAVSAECPTHGQALLLHGIYVKPDIMGSGIGRSLLQASAGIAGALGCDGMLVKSVRQSRGFFERCGLRALRTERATDYPHRYWLQLGATNLPVTLRK